VLDYLLMTLMALLWASGFVVAKLAVVSVAPEVAAFIRFFLSSIVLMAMVAIWQRPGLRLGRRDWPLVLGLGATGIAAYNLFFFWGVHLSLASDAAMIIPTLNPLITLFAASILLGEALTRRKLVGAGISLVGQVLIFWSLIVAAADDPARLFGDLLFVGSAICWSTYSILGRIASRRFTPMAATAWGSLSGMLLLVPFAFLALPRSTGYTPAFAGYMLYIALAGTVAGFFLWSRGVHRLGASRAAVFLNLVPVFTLFLAFVILGERPSWPQVLGMLIVLGGVYLAGGAAQRRVVASS
jgi:drug/metabolite transporter (DMT)-like permease